MKFSGPSSCGWQHSSPYREAGIFFVVTGGDTSNSASLVEYGARGVVVESFIGGESLEIDARDQRFDADAVVTLAGQ
jgi:hypothetical protein